MVWGGFRSSAGVLALISVACNDGDRGGTAGGEGSASLSASAGTDSVTATSEPTGSSAESSTQNPTDASDSAEESSTTDGFKFDLASIPDGGKIDCAKQCGETGFSYIYIANSNQSTMSKINTETMTEEGRYLTRSDSAGNPSRTSVSIDGQLGSINNRAGGGTLTVWTRPELCDPTTNGVAGLQTSTGAGDVLPWGEDDCVAWFADIAGAMRPIAWVAGEYNLDTCEYDGQFLWVATTSPVVAYRLDRDTGTILDMVSVPEVSYGYGGAADSEGNFWIISLGTELARVDVDDLSVQGWTIPHSVYGITVASDGNVWMSANMSSTTSAVRFTPTTETFDLATGNIAWAQSGIAEDAMGRMWMNDWNSPYSIYPIDKDTMVTGDPFVVTGATSSAKGIAVDRNGLVWTAHFDNRAYRMDPDGNVVDNYAGLDYPYTYSDMTGGALTGVTCGSPTG